MPLLLALVVSLFALGGSEAECNEVDECPEQLLLDVSLLQRKMEYEVDWSGNALARDVRPMAGAGAAGAGAAGAEGAADGAAAPPPALARSLGDSEAAGGVGAGARGAERSAASASSCPYEVLEGKGFASLVVEASGQAAIGVDFTDALQGGGPVTVMVTAMTTAGEFVDELGFVNEFATPVEGTRSTVFEFRLSPDGQSVDVYKPQMDVRTSDEESRRAVAIGLGSGWLDTLPRIQTPLCRGWKNPTLGSGDRIIVDGYNLILQGFYVFPGGPQSQRLLRVEAFPTNFDVTVEFLQATQPAASPLQIGYSVLLLPRTPMLPRISDERLLFFTTDYVDKGSHQEIASEMPHEAVDRQVKMIWRYNLPRIGKIRIHVDPTVPARWREYFRAGIEAWNDAFAGAGAIGAVQAVLPEDPEWPQDYNVADARYSTISWSLTQSVVSMGIAKVDPRSGEIMKSDIIMSDGWVRSWLSDLDLLAPNVTHLLAGSGSSSYDGSSGGSSGGSSSIAASPALLQQHAAARALAAGGAAANESTHRNGVRLEPQLPRSRRKFEGNRSRAFEGMVIDFSLLSANASRQPLSEKEQDALLGAGLKEIVMHETGHILGLRHNFKGSLGVSFDCTQNISCSAEEGLTASVMDYVPMNIPRADGPKVHPFTPVVGAYDKLAIRYGYTNSSKRSFPAVPAELQEVLKAAELFPPCYDNDEYGEDPACMAYDFTGDPLLYYEHQLERFAEAQRYLINMTVMPGASVLHFGAAAHLLLRQTEGVALDAVSWVGGIYNSYVHRDVQGPYGPIREARHPVPASLQRKALQIALRVLRPDQAGLLPPKQYWQFLVVGSDGGSVESLDVHALVTAMGQNLIKTLLSGRRAAQVLKQANISPEGTSGLSLAEYFSLAVDGVLGLGLDVLDPEEWALHIELIMSLESLLGVGSPMEVRTHAAYHLERLRLAIEDALSRGRKSGVGAAWEQCANSLQTCTCDGLVRLGDGQAWSPAIAAAGTVACQPQLFSKEALSFGKAVVCECLSSRPDEADLQLVHLTSLLRLLENKSGLPARMEIVEGDKMAGNVSDPSTAMPLPRLPGAVMLLLLVASHWP